MMRDHCKFYPGLVQDACKLAPSLEPRLASAPGAALAGKSRDPRPGPHPRSRKSPYSAQLNRPKLLAEGVLELEADVSLVSVRTISCSLIVPENLLFWMTTPLPNPCMVDCTRGRVGCNLSQPRKLHPAKPS